MNSIQSHIRLRCAQKLPGERSHKKMYPQISKIYESQTPAVESAVLICIFERDTTLYSIYTKRSIHLNDKHSGQISFPGGKFEDEDITFEKTALRECFEEIGIPISPEAICGKLSELYIPISNFNVRPYIAFLDKAPENYKKQITEVAEIIEIPLQTLLLPESQCVKTVERNGVTITAPHYSYKQHHIWGATAMITAELLDVIF